MKRNSPVTKRSYFSFELFSSKSLVRTGLFGSVTAHQEHNVRWISYDSDGQDGARDGMLNTPHRQVRRSRV